MFMICLNLRSTSCSRIPLNATLRSREIGDTISPALLSKLGVLMGVRGDMEDTFSISLGGFVPCQGFLRRVDSR